MIHIHKGPYKFTTCEKQCKCHKLEVLYSTVVEGKYFRLQRTKVISGLMQYADTGEKYWPRYMHYSIYTKPCIHLKSCSYTKPAHTKNKILFKQVLMQQEGQLTYQKKVKKK